MSKLIKYADMSELERSLFDHEIERQHEELTHKTAFTTFRENRRNDGYTQEGLDILKRNLDQENIIHTNSLSSPEVFEIDNILEKGPKQQGSFADSVEANRNDPEKGGGWPRCLTTSPQKQKARGRKSPRLFCCTVA